MGGNVFNNTANIHKDNIDSTLSVYFEYLSNLFPLKAEVFNTKVFELTGSAKKKEYSGDIDLAINTKDIIPDYSEHELKKWNITPASLKAKADKLHSRARTASYEGCVDKAFLILVSENMSMPSPMFEVDIKKASANHIFTSFRQYDCNGEELMTNVQIDWMLGDKDWLRFTYYSKSYEGNVKGLHRTQALVAMFYALGYSFSHAKGLTHKETGEMVTTVKELLAILSAHMETIITEERAEDYFELHDIFKESAYYQKWLKTYFKILDSTRCDIPENIQHEWIRMKPLLDLKGKFLPPTSKLINIDITTYLSTRNIQ